MWYVGIIGLADGIKNNGALSKLIFGGDHWKSPLDGWTTPEPVTLEVGMTEADFGNKGLQAAGAIIVAAWLSHKDKGALTSLNLAANNLGQLVLPEGWRGPDDDGEYKDPDGKYHKQTRIQRPGIIALANVIPDMGALSKLDMRKNNINAKGKSALKKAAGVGIFRSRYVELQHLSVYSSLQYTCSFFFTRAQDQASTLGRNVCTNHVL
jgi:hypothetical protein